MARTRIHKGMEYALSCENRFWIKKNEQANSGAEFKKWLNGLVQVCCRFRCKIRARLLKIGRAVLFWRK